MATCLPVSAKKSLGEKKHFLLQTCTHTPPCHPKAVRGRGLDGILTSACPLREPSRSGLPSSLRLPVTGPSTPAARPHRRSQSSSVSSVDIFRVAVRSTVHMSVRTPPRVMLFLRLKSYENGPWLQDEAQILQKAPFPPIALSSPSTLLAARPRHTLAFSAPATLGSLPRPKDATLSLAIALSPLFHPKPPPSSSPLTD